MKKNAFARLLALALCMTAFAWNIAAFEPETPENADEIAISETPPWPKKHNMPKSRQV